GADREIGKGVTGRRTWPGAAATPASRAIRAKVPTRRSDTDMPVLLYVVNPGPEDHPARQRLPLRSSYAFFRRRRKEKPPPAGGIFLWRGPIIRRTRRH